MQRHHFFRRRILLATAVIGCFCASLSIMAQDAPPTDTENALKTTVHLRIGPTALADVVTMLSKQTGISVRCVNSLQDHRMTLQMDNMSAKSVLEAMGELNGWIWKEIAPQQILISRPPLLEPRSLAEVPHALQQTLPKDFQRFLMLTETGKPSDEQDRMMQAAGLYHSSSLCSRFLQKLNPLVQKHASSLLTSLKASSRQPDLLIDRELPYTGLSSEQQQELLVTVVLRGIGRCFRENRNYDLVANTLLPYQLDPEQAEITIQNGGLFVGLTRKFQYQGNESLMIVGFGEQILLELFKNSP